MKTHVVLIMIKHISDHLRCYLPEVTSPPGGLVAGPAHLPAHLTGTHAGSFPSPLQDKSLFFFKRHRGVIKDSFVTLSEDIRQRKTSKPRKSNFQEDSGGDTRHTCVYVCV